MVKGTATLYSGMFKLRVDYLATGEAKVPQTLHHHLLGFTRGECPCYTEDRLGYDHK